MRRLFVSKKSVLGWLILVSWVLAGCTTMGTVKDVAVPPSGFDPKMKAVCHTQNTMVVTELPAAFLQNKPKVVLLVKLQAITLTNDIARAANWAPFRPSISINDKPNIFFRLDPFRPIQFKAVEIDASDLKPGLNTIRLSSGHDSGRYSCSGPCCAFGIGLAFEDDPRIPFI